jgi:hypothetical protein
MWSLPPARRSHCRQPEYPPALKHCLWVASSHESERLDFVDTCLSDSLLHFLVNNPIMPQTYSPCCRAKPSCVQYRATWPALSTWQKGYLSRSTMSAFSVLLLLWAPSTEYSQDNSS